MITLTLTEEQALEIFSQISKRVLKPATIQVQAHKPKNKYYMPKSFGSHKTTNVKVKNYIDKNYIVGQVFKNSDLQRPLNLDTYQVSQGLVAMRTKYQLCLIKRGLWQVTNPETVNYLT